jgi:5-methylthioadenosine/S-adenosylhomocysteine deaminase
MATLGGARALGWEDRIGSFEPGKQADACAVRLDEIESVPFFHVVSQLVYAGNGAR